MPGPGGHAVEGFAVLRAFHIFIPFSPSCLSSAGACCVSLHPRGADLRQGFEASALFLGVIPGENETGK